MKFALAISILALSFAVNDGHRTSLRSNSRALDATDAPFFKCGASLYCVTNRSTCENESSCKCKKGFGGDLCEPIDLCLEGEYPCAAGNTTTSYCVKADAPRNYKCGCRSPYKAVLPDQLDSTDDPSTPLDWRPLDCIEEVDVSTDAPITAAPITAAPVAPTPSPVTEGTCQVDSDCNSASNFECNAGTCTCKAGFFLTPGLGRCQNQDECQAGYPNDCHKYATCTNLDPPAFYSCSCNDGFRDKFPGLYKTGTVCENISECETGTHDCEAQGLTCVDRVPPMKWECVEPTPAPTLRPTPRPTVPQPICAFGRMRNLEATGSDEEEKNRRLAGCTP